MAGVHDSIAEIEQRIGWLRANVAGIRNDTDKRVQSLEAHVDKLETAMAALRAAFGNLDPDDVTPDPGPDPGPTPTPDPDPDPPGPVAASIVEESPGVLRFDAGDHDATEFALMWWAWSNALGKLVRYSQRTTTKVTRVDVSELVPGPIRAAMEIPPDWNKIVDVPAIHLTGTAPLQAPSGLQFVADPSGMQGEIHFTGDPTADRHEAQVVGKTAWADVTSPFTIAGIANGDDVTVRSHRGTETQETTLRIGFVKPPQTGAFDFDAAATALPIPPHNSHVHSPDFTALLAGNAPTAAAGEIVTWPGLDPEQYALKITDDATHAVGCRGQYPRGAVSSSRIWLDGGVERCILMYILDSGGANWLVDVRRDGPAIPGVADATWAIVPGSRRLCPFNTGEQTWTFLNNYQGNAGIAMGHRRVGGVSRLHMYDLNVGVMAEITDHPLLPLDCTPYQHGGTRVTWNMCSADNRYYAWTNGDNAVEREAYSVIDLLTDTIHHTTFQAIREIGSPTGSWVAGQSGSASGGATFTVVDVDDHASVGGKKTALLRITSIGAGTRTLIAQGETLTLGNGATGTADSLHWPNDPFLSKGGRYLVGQNAVNTSDWPSGGRDLVWDVEADTVRRIDMDASHPSITSNHNIVAADSQQNSTTAIEDLTDPNSDAIQIYGRSEISANGVYNGSSMAFSYQGQGAVEPFLRSVYGRNNDDLDDQGLVWTHQGGGIYTAAAVNLKWDFDEQGITTCYYFTDATNDTVAGSLALAADENLQPGEFYHDAPGTRDQGTIFARMPDDSDPTGLVRFFALAPAGHGIAWLWEDGRPARFVGPHYAWGDDYWSLTRFQAQPDGRFVFGSTNLGDEANTVRNKHIFLLTMPGA